MLVYLITNKINGKQYVGQTSKSLDIRWKDHVQVRLRPSCSYLHHAIDKYGSDNFLVEVLVTVQTKEETNFYERALIKALGTKAPNGYNLTDGGDGGTGYVFTDEQRRKVSEGQMGRKMSSKAREKLLERNEGNKFSLGVKMPEEHRLKLIAINTGSTRSEETLVRMSASKIGNKNALGMKHSEETRRKIAEAGLLHAHERYHVKRGIINPNCKLCKEQQCKTCESTSQEQISPTHSNTATT